MDEYPGRYPKGGTSGDTEIRRPLTTDASESLVEERRAEWSENLNKIPITISGHKADRLNQGMIWPHNVIPGGGVQFTSAPGTITDRTLGDSPVVVPWGKRKGIRILEVRKTD